MVKKLHDKIAQFQDANIIREMGLYHLFQADRVWAGY